MPANFNQLIYRLTIYGRIGLNWLTAIMAMIRYGWPQRGLRLVAITGTDGKTTTVQLLASVLRADGRKVGLISTVGASIDGQVLPLPAHVSTPGPAEIMALLRQMQQRGVTDVIVETTSHGLDQRRVAGLRFAVGVITNISPEHLDYHRTFERYVTAKARLIKLSRRMVLNIDDQAVAGLVESSQQPILFGLNHGFVHTEALSTSANGSSFTLMIDTKHQAVRLRLPGSYNISNALAAAAAASLLDVDLLTIARGLGEVTGVAGRWQVVQSQPFWVIVDFGHTPQAFAQILPMAKELAGHHDLIHVFGSAGGRDAFKRSQMGELSGRYADITVLTMEDPRHESVDKIQQQILSGLSKTERVKQHQRIDDRRQAITWAVNQAKPGDVVLLTGKGHEVSMNIAGTEVPWNEMAEAKLGLEENRR